MAKGKSQGPTHRDPPPGPPPQPEEEKWGARAVPAHPLFAAGSNPGRSLRVAVFARGVKAVEARRAGADIVGAEDLIEQIEKGVIAFDRCIATPDMMGLVAKVSAKLGPRGLMPNLRVGTVTDDVAYAVHSAKQFTVRFKGFGLTAAGNFTMAQVREIAGMASEAPAVIEVRLAAVERQLSDLVRENAQLKEALAAEGVFVASQLGERAEDEPFGLPDPVPLADRAPRNPRVARLVARLRSASADEIAVRAEKADEERLAMMKGTAKKL